VTWQEELGLRPGEEIKAGASNPDDLEPDAGKLAERILADPIQASEGDPGWRTAEWDLGVHSHAPAMGKAPRSKESKRDG
jgi:hypothetical protein